MAGDPAGAPLSDEQVAATNHRPALHQDVAVRAMPLFKIEDPLGRRVDWRISLEGLLRFWAALPPRPGWDGRSTSGACRLIVMLGRASSIAAGALLLAHGLGSLAAADWQPTGDMRHGRLFHRVNVISDGLVLVTGGLFSTCGDLSLPSVYMVYWDPEILDLGTRSFRSIGDGPAPRYLHAAETLADGTLLVAGGCLDESCSATTDTVYLFDVPSESFRAVAPLPSPRAAMVTALLPDGRLLVAGGCDAASCEASAAAFDPVDETFTTLSPMRRARGRARAVLLRDGRVLVAGGCTTVWCDEVLAHAEVYDPARDVWDEVGSLSVPRAGHYAVELPDGRVLVGGGCVDQSCSSVHRSAELFDPETGAFGPTGPQQLPRVGARAVPLPDGRVLVILGCQSATECTLSNETYDPDVGGFAMAEPTTRHSGVRFHSTVHHRAAGLIVSVGGCAPGLTEWHGESYDVSGLGPLDAGPGGLDAGPRRVDAGPRRVDAATLDAGAFSDGGVSPPPPEGCGCAVAARPPGAGWAAFLFCIGVGFTRRKASDGSGRT